jgi:type VI secretion system protein ImpM
MSAMPQVGLFGKIPSVGDFVSRGLSPQLCEKLDQLLQAALVAATADGTDARLVMGMAQPAMVAIRPGVLCPSGFSGLWFPSQDRVGRVFPLCVGLETPAEQAKAPLIWPSFPLMQALCIGVVQAMQAANGPDEMLARMPAATDWDRLASQNIPFTSLGDETVPNAPFNDAQLALQGPESQMSVASRALGSRLPWVAEILGYSIAPDGSATRFFASRSMLAWSSFAAVFDGRWQHWAWSTHDVPQTKDVAPVTALDNGSQSVS